VVPDKANLQVKLSVPTQARDGASATETVTVTSQGPATADKVATALTEVARLAGTARRLRPFACVVLDAEPARAMDRQARVTYSEIIPLLVARDRPSRSGGPGTSGPSEGSAAPGTEAGEGLTGACPGYC
jgi:hypothetical protein